MPPVKRKAPPSDAVPNSKANRTSEASTPGGMTSGDEAEEDPQMGNMLDKFSVDAYAGGRPQHANKNYQPMQHIFKDKDFSWLSLKPDYERRPLWIDPDKGRIILESFNALAPQAQDFLITIAEPQSRPTYLHEYSLTAHSLYAAIAVGLTGKDIVGTLDRFCKVPLPPSIRSFIDKCTQSYGKVKLVLKNTKYFVETTDPAMLQRLLKDPTIGPLRVHSTAIETSTGPKAMGLIIQGTKAAVGVSTELGQDKPVGAGDVYASLDDDDDDDQEITHSFEIPDNGVETVQKRCLELGYPMLEEYDFRRDETNTNLDINLKPGTTLRPHQEKSLSKMFGNGRAKSGIIVLPCGAGKTLVGITAACTIKKGVIALCTSGVSALQWRNEFLRWSNINPDDIKVIDANNKEVFSGATGIIITTYTMVAQTRERAHDSKKFFDFISSREWGLMLLDEVHVAPANIFRKVTSHVKAHSKLGLTATLLREDDRISDLNFLIGPKLYEANWMELSEQGHIAKVQCAEVWCPMPTEFYDEYLKMTFRQRGLLSTMNPNKFQACQYLINYHESRGDKIIVFSDNLYALKQYASKLKKPYLHGGTEQRERVFILDHFQRNPEVRTLFLSKIGDTSLDLPEATCLIQISSQYGSRRQEAQRLGRILRAKRRNDEGFNAFFYSLVSKDTQEMYYSSKRQAFLVDQGYAFKVITQLANIEKTPDLAFATVTERRELLAKILVENETFSQEEEVDDLFHQGAMGRRQKRGKAAVRRTANTLSDLSGGQDMAYVEQNKRVNQSLKKKTAEKSSFFKKIQRQKEKIGK